MMKWIERWIGECMPHCPRCGLRLPEEKGIRFCPNCGTYLIHFMKLERIRINTLINRITSLLMVFVLCMAATLIGALGNVDYYEAQRMVGEVEEVQNVLRVAGVQLIFGNNLMYTLMMFIPVAGPYWGFYVLYNTGKYLAAISTVSNVNPLTLFSQLLIFPFTWMEYVSYALAISESLWIIYAVIKRNFRDEIAILAITVVVCNVLLLLGAVIEAALIILA